MSSSGIPSRVAQLSRNTDAPFVGRDPELALLTRLLEGARSGLGGVALIQGEAGIGKSRLLAELQAEARGQHFRTLVFHPQPEDVPSVPVWVEMLARLGASSGSAAEEPTPLAASSASPAEVAGRVADAVRTASAEEPLLLAIDDAQWVSKTDADLLVLLAQGVREWGHVVLVLAARDEGVQSAAAQSLVARLAATHLLLRLPLRGLSLRDVERYLAAKLGGPPPAGMREAVFDRTEGNPFFLTEVASLLASSGMADFDVTLRRIPDSVRDVVQYRFGRLPEQTRDLLVPAAVLGTEFDVALLASLVGRPAMEVMAAIDIATSEGVLIEDARPGRYRFAHALVHDTLLAPVSRAQQAELHASVAAALEVAQPPGDVAILAHHYAAAALVSSSHAAKAVHYLRLAARSAEHSADWDGAARRHEQVLDLMQQVGVRPSPGDWAAELRAAGRCWRLAGQTRLGWRHLMRAIEAARAAGDPAAAADATLEALEGIDAPPEKRRRLAEQALEAPEALEPETRARLFLQLAGYEISPEADHAVAQARRLIDRHRLTGVETRLADRDYYEAVAVGDLDRAGKQVLRRVQAAALSSDRIEEIRGSVRLAETVARSGQLTEAWGIAEQALHRASRDHLHGTADVARCLLMAIALARCDFAAFDRMSKDVRNGPVVAQLRARRFEITGNWHGALRALPAPGTPETDHPRIAWDLHGTLARLRSASGGTREARDHLADWIRRRRESHHPTDRQDALAVIGEALVAHGDEPIVRDVLEESLACDQVRFIYMTATGLDRLRGELALRLGRVEFARTYFERALEWARREELPAERAMALLGLSATGTPGDACDDRDEARSIVQRFGLALPRIEDAAPSRPASLSRADLSLREQEVLRLIATGNTNRQIGLTLGISPFTVARHVSSILTKMGVANRAEAVTCAFRDGLLPSNSTN